MASEPVERKPRRKGHQTSMANDESATTGEGCSNAQQQETPPRPPNSWILYRSAKVRELKARQEATAGKQTAKSPPQRAGKLTTSHMVLQAEVSRIVSDMWKAEGEEVKQYYSDLAKEKKRSHQVMFPDYKFRPRRQRSSSSKAKATTAANQYEARSRRGSGNSDTTAKRRSSSSQHTCETDVGASQSHALRWEDSIRSVDSPSPSSLSGMQNPFVPARPVLDLIGPQSHAEMKHSRQSELQLIAHVCDKDWSNALAATTQSAPTSEEGEVDSSLPYAAWDQPSHLGHNLPLSMGHADGYDRSIDTHGGPFSYSLEDGPGRGPLAQYPGCGIAFSYREDQAQVQEGIGATHWYSSGNRRGDDTQGTPPSASSLFGLVVGEPMLTLSPLQLTPSSVHSGSDVTPHMLPDASMSSSAAYPPTLHDFDHHHRNPASYVSQRGAEGNSRDNFASVALHNPVQLASEATLDARPEQLPEAHHVAHHALAHHQAKSQPWQQPYHSHHRHAHHLASNSLSDRYASWQVAQPASPHPSLPVHASNSATYPIPADFSSDMHQMRAMQIQQGGYSDEELMRHLHEHNEQ